MPETPQRAVPTSAPYWLYLLECEGGVYYAGIAIDVERRFLQHLFGVGARFTRARAPLRVLAAREYPGKSEALRAELRLKALARGDKLGFFAPGEQALRPRSTPAARGARASAAGSHAAPADAA